MFVEEVIRCPYCVEGSEFRLMVRRSKDRFVCVGCGHTATPADPYLKCPCVKCREMIRLASRRRTEELRNRPPGDLPARL